jgi:hypothetical protein
MITSYLPTFTWKFCICVTKLPCQKSKFQVYTCTYQLAVHSYAVWPLQRSSNSRDIDRIWTAGPHIGRLPGVPEWCGHCWLDIPWAAWQPAEGLPEVLRGPPHTEPWQVPVIPGAVIHGTSSEGEIIDPEKLQNVQAYSRTLSSVERSYCMTWWELLAIVKMEHFHKYLYGQEFHRQINHLTLTSLLSFKNLEGQMACLVHCPQE